MNVNASDCRSPQLTHFTTPSDRQLAEQGNDAKKTPHGKQSTFLAFDANLTTRLHIVAINVQLRSSPCEYLPKRPPTRRIPPSPAIDRRQKRRSRRRRRRITASFCFRLFLSRRRPRLLHHRPAFIRPSPPPLSDSSRTDRPASSVRSSGAIRRRGSN